MREICLWEKVFKNKSRTTLFSRVKKKIASWFYFQILFSTCRFFSHLLYFSMQTIGAKVEEKSPGRKFGDVRPFLHIAHSHSLLSRERPSWICLFHSRGYWDPLEGRWGKSLEAHQAKTLLFSQLLYMTQLRCFTQWSFGSVVVSYILLITFK